MKRKFEILLENDYRLLCIDSEHKNDILNYLHQDTRHRKKFLYFSEVFMQGLSIPDLYGSERIDNKTSGVTAIKFFKGNDNDRIYCKEFELNDGRTAVVMAVVLLKKKNQKLKQREKNIIKKVGSYQYEVEI